MRPTPHVADAALRALDAANAVPPLGLAFGRWLSGLDPDRAEALALSGALLVHTRHAGHSHVALTEWAGHPFPCDDPDHPLPAFPDAGDWQALLDASPLVGAPGDATPLVLDDGALYLYRFWRAEHRVAERLARRLRTPDPLASPATLRDAVRHLFPNADTTPDAQALAAAAALRHPLAVVSGGPGTGKTTTVARLLVLALDARPDLRVALAAPTGKATQRLSASLAAQFEGLGLDPARIPEATTLHRLLRASADGRFGRSADAPLPVDLVVVDEASMIDLPLFDALLDALPDTTRLVLLGDAGQLDSVEVGAAFGDLCALGDGPPSPGFAAFCDALGLAALTPDPAASPPADAVVTLTESYRFDPDAGIGALAAALLTGDADRALAVLTDPATAEATLVTGGPARALALALPHARAVVASTSPEEALGALRRFQLLAVTRRGLTGVEALNTRVEAALLDEARIPPDPYYPGRPVLVTANDYAAGLFNGDVGVAWTVDGVPSVVFPSAEHGSRALPAARLPAHESAWALTVHKSQGSEFDRVAVALPAAPSSLLTRELLYTAVTRARHAVTVVGAAPLIAHAAAHSGRRASSLGRRLHTALADSGPAPPLATP